MTACGSPRSRGPAPASSWRSWPAAERRSRRSRWRPRPITLRPAGHQAVARSRSSQVQEISRTSYTSPTRGAAGRARSSARRSSRALPGCLMAPASCMHRGRGARSGIPRFSICAPCRKTEAPIASSRSATNPTSIRRSSSPAGSSRAKFGCGRISGSFRSRALPPRTSGTEGKSHTRRRRCRRPQ